MHPSFSKKLIAGMGASTVVNVFRIGAQLISIPVLARLLGPEPFGVMAIAAPIIVITALVAELGLSGILIRENDTKIENTAFWMGVIASAVLLVPLLAATAAITHFVHPDVLPVMLTLSIMLIMTAMLAVPVARLTRAGKLTSIARGDAVGVVAGLAIAIYGALHGWGVYSLAAQQIAILLGRLLIFAAEARFLPALQFDRAQARRLARSCASMTGSNLCATSARMLDNFLVGALLGTRPAGSYAMAYQLVRVPEMLLSGPIYMAITSAATQTANSSQDRLRALYALTSQALALMAIPAMMGLALVSDPLVDALLGQQWRSTGPVLASLAGAGLFQALNMHNIAFLMGCGEYRQQFKIGWITLAATITGVIVGSRWQTIGVGYGVTAASLLGFGISTAAVARCLDIPLIRALGGVWNSILPTSAMVAAVVGVQHMLPPGVEPRLALPIPIAAGMLAYLVALMLFGRRRLVLRLAALGHDRSPSLSPAAPVVLKSAE